MGIFSKPSAAEQKKRDLAEQKKKRQGRRIGKDGKDQLGIQG